MPDQIKFNSPWNVATMEDLFNDVVSAKGSAASLTAAMAAKQDLLTVGTNMDASPTDGHTTVPVTSDGVYDAIQAAISEAVSKIFVGTQFPAGADLNNFTTPGRYYTKGGSETTGTRSLSNRPLTGTNQMNYAISMGVYLMNDSANGNLLQIIYTAGGSAQSIFARAAWYGSGQYTWKPWFEFAGVQV